MGVKKGERGLKRGGWGGGKRGMIRGGGRKKGKRARGSLKVPFRFG